MKKNWMAALLAGLMMACGTGAAAEQEAVEPLLPALELPEAEGGRVIGIPVEQDDRKTNIPPREEGYLYDQGTEEAVGYADPSITVRLGRGRFLETNYIYARVRIAGASQLRTLMASPPASMYTAPGHDLAKRVGAVIAINGDFCGGEDITRGVLMRQGKILRKKGNGNFDLLVVDREGDFHILQKADNEDVAEVIDQAVNIFTFGPALVVDGLPKYGSVNGNIGSGKPTQRMAICQTGKLEYLLITCEGPENPGSVGLTIDQFVELISSFPEVEHAYNLDGGSSATMVFRVGEENWRKINAQSSRKIRPLKDIVYFSSAWEPEN